jgi:hypothetical protein
MRSPILPRLFACFLAASLVTAAPVARAAFQIEELYSNADGTVQYLVLHETAGSNGLQGLHLAALTSNHSGSSKTYLFTNDLPSNLTANTRVLVATEGFAALGVVVPDYVVPNQFFATDAATLIFDGTDPFGYSSLPTDGVNATFISGGTPGVGPVVTVSPNVATNFAGNSASVIAQPVTAVEYYNPALDHYFMSALQPDIDALDRGIIAGWRRTGFSFKVFPTQANGGPGVNPVCRFYIPPQHGNSHFFSASLDECAAILQASMTDPNYSGYVLETSNAFYIALPDTTTGACPAGTIPVYRLWNQRADSNHRYTTDLGIKAQMIQRGYVAEGYGPDKVIMCAVNTPLTSVQVRVSGATPFAAGCDGVAPTGTLYTNAEVEPMVSINPRNPANIVGVWQQDRWSDGGARGMLTGASFDGGKTWALTMAAFSRCAGGNAGNGADYARSSDPWVSFGPDGTVYQSAIAFNGGTLTPGSSGAVLASRSIDGGLTWSPPAVLISDGSAFFNDKDSITADPTDARLVYAVWDRTTNSSGPTYFVRSTDGGVTWEPARSIYDPGVHRQTLNNQIVVASDGTVVNFFTALDFVSGAVALQVLRSVDKGVSWSAPITISSVLSVGTSGIRDGSTLGSIAAGPHGQLAAVWQDMRFSSVLGQVPHDGVAFSQSLDGGLTWSVPVGINGAPGVAAFEPTVSYRSDGTVGATYFDFRPGPGMLGTIPTDYWLTRSGDGIVWRETQVSGPFDFATAPNAEGLFVGDYQGLASVGESFLPFFAQTNSGDLLNPTDIFIDLTQPVVVPVAQPVQPIRGTEAMHQVRPGTSLLMTPELAQQLRDSVTRAIQRRMNGTGP